MLPYQVYESRQEKINKLNVVYEQVRPKPSCTNTEDGERQSSQAKGSNSTSFLSKEVELVPLACEDG